MMDGIRLETSTGNDYRRLWLAISMTTNKNSMYGWNQNDTEYGDFASTKAYGLILATQ